MEMFSLADSLARGRVRSPWRVPNEEEDFETASRLFKFTRLVTFRKLGRSFFFGMAAMALILTASVLAQTFQGNCTLTGRKPKRVRLELLSYRTPQPGAARASYGGYTTA